MGRPVGPERVRVGETIRDPGRETVAVDQPVDRLSGQGLWLLPAVATEPHEQRMFVTQAGGLRQRIARDPEPAARPCGGTSELSFLLDDDDVEAQ